MLEASQRQNGQGSIIVWMVEDGRRYAETIKDLVCSHPRMLCEELFETAEEVLQALNERFAPDVILMDIGLPGMDGVTCVREIRQRTAGTHIIMLTVHQEMDTIFNAICAGASGYLLKGESNDQILKAIEDVTEGRSPINGQIARRVLDIFTQRFRQSWNHGLTDREMEVLQLLAEGLTKKQIADELYLATHTVDTHVRGIYDKLQVNSAVSAVVTAIKEGIIKI